MADTGGEAPRISFDVVGSTNEEALARARAGERGPLWVTASRQQSGRGRRGRQWVSEPGNLYASLLLSDPSLPERAPELSFVAALAAHDAVSVLVPALADRIALKWPNDLLVSGAKFGGILIEAEGGGRAAVIGIGVNCKHHPPGTPYPAADLAGAGADVAADDLFGALAAAMTRRLAQWDRGQGFATIRADWLARAAGLGEDICILVGVNELSGRFETIDDIGRLVLRLPDDSAQAFAAGEVTRLAHSGAGAES